MESKITILLHNQEFKPKSGGNLPFTFEKERKNLDFFFLKIWHHISKQAVRGTTEEGGSHPAHTHCQQRCPVSSIQLQVKQLKFIEECQHDFQVDEQSPSAGTPSQCHHPFVGHLSGWAWRVQVILIIKLWIYVFFVFSKFHLYVCAAFLKRWKTELEQKKDFQGILLFIQVSSVTTKFIFENSCRYKWSFVPFRMCPQPSGMTKTLVSL